MLTINAGSGAIADSGEGWTNTYEQAEREALKWLAQMQAEGFTDIAVTLPGTGPRDGRWIFRFEHDVTGVPVLLEIHGIDDLEAYRKQHVFHARVYWNGSSSGNPKLEDFAAEGFTPAMTFRPVVSS